MSALDLDWASSISAATSTSFCKCQPGCQQVSGGCKCTDGKIRPCVNTSTSNLKPNQATAHTDPFSSGRFYRKQNPAPKPKPPSSDIGQLVNQLEQIPQAGNTPSPSPAPSGSGSSSSSSFIPPDASTKLFNSVCKNNIPFLCKDQGRFMMIAMTLAAIAVFLLFKRK